MGVEGSSAYHSLSLLTKNHHLHLQFTRNAKIFRSLVIWQLPLHFTTFWPIARFLWELELFMFYILVRLAILYTFAFTLNFLGSIVSEISKKRKLKYLFLSFHPYLRFYSADFVHIQTRSHKRKQKFQNLFKLLDYRVYRQTYRQTYRLLFTSLSKAQHN